jgi:hypothetical protein
MCGAISLDVASRIANTIHWENDFYVYEEKLPIILSEGTLIDIETTGLPDGFRTAPSSMFTFGFIVNNKLSVVQNLNMPLKYFENYVSTNIIEVLPLPYYAWNCSFEANHLKRDAEWIELQPFKYAKKHELIKINRYDYEDVGNGPDCPKWWAVWRSSLPLQSRKVALVKVIIHNRACLIKEIVALVAFCGARLDNERIIGIKNEEGCAL